MFQSNRQDNGESHVFNFFPLFSFCVCLQSVCGVLAHVCELGGQKSMTSVFLKPSPQYISFQHGLSLSPELTDSSILLDQQALESSCLYLYSVLNSFHVFKVIFLNVYLCMYICICHMYNTFGGQNRMSYLIIGGCVL